MVDFSLRDENFDISTVAPMCPEGSYEFNIEFIENEIKKTFKGTEYLQFSLKRAGFRNVYCKMFLGNKQIMLAKILNFFAAVGVKLEKRSYSSDELLLMLTKTKNKKVVGEVVHEMYVDKTGQEKTIATISVFSPAHEQTKSEETSKRANELIDELM